MMLAYPATRAREATLKLKEALREEEAPYLDRVLCAISELRLQPQRQRPGPRRTLEACVQRQHEPRKDLGLKVRASKARSHADAVSDPPTAIVEKSLSRASSPQAGVCAPSSTRRHDPRAFEIFADRRDLPP
jgi:hypothetical protein